MDWIKSDKHVSLRQYLGDDPGSFRGKAFLSRQKSMVLINGKLYLTCISIGDAEPNRVFIVLRAHRQKAIDGCHWDAGHQGQNHTASLLSERFWWPGMTTEAKKAVKFCDKCVKHEGDGGTVPLHPIIASGPMDLLHMDFTKIKIGGDNEQELKKQPKVTNILVIMDHFTCHTMAFTTKDQTAATVARVLYYNYMCIFGSPIRLMFDNNSSFTSEVVRELCALFGVKTICTSMYHP